MHHEPLALAGRLGLVALRRAVAAERKDEHIGARGGGGRAGGRVGASGVDGVAGRRVAEHVVELRLDVLERRVLALQRTDVGRRDLAVRHEHLKVPVGVVLRARQVADAFGPVGVDADHEPPPRASALPVVVADPAALRAGLDVDAVRVELAGKLLLVRVDKVRDGDLLDELGDARLDAVGALLELLLLRAAGVHRLEVLDVFALARRRRRRVDMHEGVLDCLSQLVDRARERVGDRVRGDADKMEQRLRRLDAVDRERVRGLAVGRDALEAESTTKCQLCVSC